MADTRQYRVLVVDDSLFMRRELKIILEKYGFALAGEANNGLEAIKAYKTSRPDVVLLDIVMPIMDGISTLRTIRELDPTACVIMVSSMSMQQKVVEAARAGAKQFVVKPFKEEQVVARIKQVLGLPA
ncbi:MAG: response regulator [Candidatus Schekmanbacteria bacterium]|nr:response regulator [Candidatus Schekmanbacteria bacterium]